VEIAIGLLQFGNKTDPFPIPWKPFKIIVLPTGCFIPSASNFFSAAQPLQNIGINLLAAEFIEHLMPAFGIQLHLQVLQAALLEQGTTLLGEALRGNLRGAVLILGVVLLCGAADAVLRTPESPMRRFLPMAGAAAIAVLSLGSMKSLLGLGTQTIEELDVFSKALLPTLAAAVAAGGGAVTAGTGQVIAVCFADALITLIRGLLLPMTYFLAAAATADAMLPRHGLGTVAKAASRVVTWLLTGSLVLFTGYLTLSGAVSTSADALTVQVTRSAVGAMPVVGRILSDAAGSVLAGAGVVKNAIGVFGLLGVLAACLGPFVRLGVQYLLYKLTAFLAGMTAAPELAKLIDALGGVFGLMLGMTGSCALLLLISISSAILVVTP